MFDKDERNDFLDSKSYKDKSRYLEFLEIDKYINLLEDLSDEDIVLLREEYRKYADIIEESFKKFYLNLGLNEILAELIIVKRRDLMFYDLMMKSRSGEWFTLRFPLGTRETVLVNYNRILKELQTKPTPEECKDYFETIGIEVEIISSKWIKWGI